MGNITDNNGMYFLELDSGVHRVVFRQISKKAVYYIVSLYGHGVIDVLMDNKEFELELFTVLSEEKDRNVRNPITGVTKMSIEKIKLIPAFIGEPDVINSLQLMPGVTSVGEGSSGLSSATAMLWDSYLPSMVTWSRTLLYIRVLFQVIMVGEAPPP